MITNLQAILLGLLQGLTEFLPVSSSGHLVLGQRLMGFQEPEILFDVAVHVGTLVAVVFYFRADLWSMARGLWANDRDAVLGRKLIYLVVAGSIPTALLGFFCKDLFERMFSSLWAVGTALVVTAFLLLLTPPGSGKRRRSGAHRTPKGLLGGAGPGPGHNPRFKPLWQHHSRRAFAGLGPPPGRQALFCDVHPRHFGGSCFAAFPCRILEPDPARALSGGRTDRRG